MMLQNQGVGSGKFQTEWFMKGLENEYKRCTAIFNITVQEHRYHQYSFPLQVSINE